MRSDLLRPAMLVAASLLAYLVIALVIGRFPVTDEVVFKSAGRQWAAGAGFGSPELTGAFGDMSPPVTEVFFLHMPTYPFLFGVWTRIVGFGPRQCMMFDALVHVLLSGLTFVLGCRVFLSLGRARGWLAAAVAVAVLPLGSLGRPDELAMSLGMVCWFLLLAPQLRTVSLVVAGVALGVCLGTSPGAVPAAALVALALLLFRIADGWKSLVVRGLLLGAGALLGAAISLGPLLIAHPNAPNQYVVHARFLLKRISILNAWQEAWPHSTKYYTFLIGTFLSGLVATALIGTRKAWRVWATYGLGASLFLICLAMSLALHATYTWFIGPWIMLAAAHTIYLLAITPGRRMRVVLPALLLVSGYCSFAVYFVKETVVVATLPPEQRVGAASTWLRSVIPAGASVLTKDAWWLIADHAKTYDPMFSHPPPDSIQYVVLSANGSGVPGKALALDPAIWDSSFTNRMVEIANDLPQQPTRVLGVRLTNSSYGYGSVVYRMSPAR